MNTWPKAYIALFLLLCFFISFRTLPDYGANWDTYQHLARGQAYFHFFATGQKDNATIEPYEGRMSFYEQTPLDFTWAQKMTIGHPPLHDILLAASNHLTFKRLNILSDMDGYHVYGVILVFFGACIIGLWTFELFGGFASCISILAYYSFPLLFAEQHFNIKDPAVMVYTLVFLYLFWKGMTKRKAWYFFLSSLFFGLSLGTKFNILFSLVFLALWVIFYMIGLVHKRTISVHTVFSEYWRQYGWKCTAGLLSIPLIGFLMFFLSYPALWSDPVHNVMSVVSYYRDIGGAVCSAYPLTPQWFFSCFDRHTLRLLTSTLPLSTIVLAFIGTLYGLKRLSAYGMAPFLWICMLMVLVIRVVFPVSALYGGSLRQIMEIIIPLSLLSGVGAYWLIRHFHNRIYMYVGIWLLFVPVIIAMYTLHPNENLYRSTLGKTLYARFGTEDVNGIVSYGNAYKQAIEWLNTHAEPNARVTLVNGLFSSVPVFFFRNDLSYTPLHWSGWDQKGEYLIEQTDAGSHVASFFPYRYATRVLKPVYEKRVDGYPIVRVWKNESQLAYPQFQKEPQKQKIQDVSRPDDDEVLVSLREPALLKELIIRTEDPSCKQALGESYVLISEDGKTFQRMYEDMSYFADAADKEGADAVYYFSGERTQFVKLFIHGASVCDLTNNSYEVVSFAQ